MVFITLWMLLALLVIIICRVITCVREIARVLGHSHGLFLMKKPDITINGQIFLMMEGAFS